MIFGKHINRYYLRYLYALLLGIAALVLVDVVQLRIPELYRILVNGINKGYGEVGGTVLPFDMDFLLEHICRPMILVVVLMVIGRFLWRICLFGSAIRMETDLRRRMFDHCRFLSQQYYQVNKVGNLMALFTNDLETVQDCFGSGVLMFFDALCLGILALLKMQNMHPLLTLFTLVPLAFLLVAGMTIDKYLTASWDHRQETFSAISDFAQESFSGISVVKAFVKEAKELGSFCILNRKNEDANVANKRLSVLFDITVTLFVESVICVILGYGGYLVHEGVFDAGQLVEFIGYFSAAVWPIMAISEMIGMRSRAKASLKRIGELLDAPVDIADAPGAESVSVLTGEIEVKDLSFRYPGTERDVLKHVSFHIAAGERVGIIGRTGCGKSTLMDLLLRTYNVADGTIFLDGRDINTLRLQDIRRNTAYVPQDNFLFSDTIHRNIAFTAGLNDCADSTEKTENAAKLSDIYADVCAFPSSFETVLGERGVTVSGGQKQRISIARALYREAPILILDDSVSAVDVSTEKTILGNLHATRANKTTLLIAHRVSTIESMDKILFMEDGMLVAVGSHAELYETCPSYRAAVDLQRLNDQSEEINSHA